MYENDQISKILLPDNQLYDIKDKNARNFTNIPYYKQDEEALMFQLGESYMTEEQDNQPYLFRAAGGSADIGNREYDKIIGGTVVWNQLVAFSPSQIPTARDGLTFTANADNSAVIVNGTATQASSASGWFNMSNGRLSDDRLNHVIVFGSQMISGTCSLNAFLDWTSNIRFIRSVRNIGEWNIGKITGSAGETRRMVLNIQNTSVCENYCIRFQCFDLTQMFGSTIAGYIYSLEQATPGAGVAWFRKLFPKPYYEYNAGELISVSGLRSHDMIGFNQWDEEWEVGGIDNTTGTNGSRTDRIRSKNYITCLPNTTYYFYEKLLNSIRMFYYDAAQDFISASNVIEPNVTFVTSENAYFMRFIVVASDMNNNDICINLSGDGERDGEYEPYKLHSYPLDSSLTLRGIPKLNTNNQLYYDGDIYEADGTVMRKYRIVDLGTLSWEYRNAFFRANPTGYKKPNSQNAMINAICNGYMQNTWNHIGVSDKEYAFSISINTPEVIFKNTAYSDVAAFKAAMSGVMLVYELATPTTEIAEPYDNPQIVAPEGTEEYITTSIIPVGHETKY